MCGDITGQSISSVQAAGRASSMTIARTTATNQGIEQGGVDAPRADGDLVPDQSAFLNARKTKNNTTTETQHDE
jgi:hypothetical protein